MNPKMLKGALLLRRNLIVLLISFIFFNNILFSLPFFNLWFASPVQYIIGLPLHQFTTFMMSLLVYAGFVAQSLTSSKFRKEFEQRELVSGIKKIHEESRQNAKILKRKLEYSAQARLDNVMREADEIVHSFMTGDRNYLKVRTVQQALKLTSAYVKLADMFRIRSLASGNERISQLAKRINTNSSNLNTVRDSGVASELKKVIEADERMIESLKNEKLELERIDARLQYMESTLGMLKYNVISNLESEDFLNNLETEVIEADALNSVLNDHYEERREGQRLRF